MNDYVQNRYSVLNPLHQDTCNFTGKIPSIVAPTMEDLINRTKAVDILRFNILRLAKHEVPCPCCGHVMLDVETFNKFEEKVLQTTEPGKLLGLISPLKRYLHPVEAEIFKMFKTMHHSFPNMSLHDILKEKLITSEARLIAEQSNILISLGIAARQLPENQNKLVQELIGETYERLLDKRDTSRFSRHIFINKLESILGDGSYDKILQSRLIEIAAQLPAAYNNIDAFIVKYAKRDYKNWNPDQKITLRMLSNSLGTVEHIFARKLRGETSPRNLSLECAACNNKKGHDTIVEQVLENPSMLINYPRYVNRLIELHKLKLLEKDYILETNETYRLASEGLLDINLDDLRAYKHKNPKRVRDDRTPTKAERRALRKEKLKIKKLKRSYRRNPQNDFNFNIPHHNNKK